jgi:hypothetical protein
MGIPQYYFTTYDQQIEAHCVYFPQVPREQDHRDKQMARKKSEEANRKPSRIPVLIRTKACNLCRFSPY